MITSTESGSNPSGRRYVTGESEGGRAVISHTAAWRTPFPLGGFGYSGFALYQLSSMGQRTLTTSTAVDE